MNGVGERQQLSPHDHQHQQQSATTHVVVYLTTSGLPSSAVTLDQLHRYAAFDVYASATFSQVLRFAAAHAAREDGDIVLSEHSESRLYLLKVDQTRATAVVSSEAIADMMKSSLVTMGLGSLPCVYLLLRCTTTTTTSVAGASSSPMGRHGNMRFVPSTSSPMKGTANATAAINSSSSVVDTTNHVDLIYVRVLGQMIAKSTKVVLNCDPQQSVEQLFPLLQARWSQLHSHHEEANTVNEEFNAGTHAFHLVTLLGVGSGKLERVLQPLERLAHLVLPGSNVLSVYVKKIPPQPQHDEAMNKGSSTRDRDHLAFRDKCFISSRTWKDDEDEEGSDFNVPVDSSNTAFSASLQGALDIPNAPTEGIATTSVVRVQLDLEPIGGLEDDSDSGLDPHTNVVRFAEHVEEFTILGVPEALDSAPVVAANMVDALLGEFDIQDNATDHRLEEEDSSCAIFSRGGTGGASTEWNEYPLSFLMLIGGDTPARYCDPTDTDHTTVKRYITEAHWNYLGRVTKELQEDEWHVQQCLTGLVVNRTFPTALDESPASPSSNATTSFTGLSIPMQLFLAETDAALRALSGDLSDDGGVRLGEDDNVVTSSPSASQKRLVDAPPLLLTMDFEIDDVETVCGAPLTRKTKQEPHTLGSNGRGSDPLSISEMTTGGDAGEASHAPSLPLHPPSSPPMLNDEILRELHSAEVRDAINYLYNASLHDSVVVASAQPVFQTRTSEMAEPLHTHENGPSLPLPPFLRDVDQMVDSLPPLGAASIDRNNAKYSERQASFFRQQALVPLLPEHRRIHEARQAQRQQELNHRNVPARSLQPLPVSGALRKSAARALQPLQRQTNGGVHDHANDARTGAMMLYPSQECSSPMHHRQGHPAYYQQPQHLLSGSPQSPLPAANHWENLQRASDVYNHSYRSSSSLPQVPVSSPHARHHHLTDALSNGDGGGGSPLHHGSPLRSSTHHRQHEGVQEPLLTHQSPFVPDRSSGASNLDALRASVVAEYTQRLLEERRDIELRAAELSRLLQLANAPSSLSLHGSFASPQDGRRLR